MNEIPSLYNFSDLKPLITKDLSALLPQHSLIQNQEDALTITEKEKSIRISWEEIQKSSEVSEHIFATQKKINELAEEIAEKTAELHHLQAS